MTPRTDFTPDYTPDYQPRGLTSGEGVATVTGLAILVGLASVGAQGGDGSVTGPRVVQVAPPRRAVTVRARSFAIALEQAEVTAHGATTVVASPIAVEVTLAPVLAMGVQNPSETELLWLLEAAA